MNRTIHSVITLFGFGLAHATGIAIAAPTTFVIDSNQSFLTLSIATQLGDQFTVPQFPGSDTTSLSGTQTVGVTGSSVQFLSTGDIHLANQSTTVAPAIGGAFPGSAPGQWGLLATLPGIVAGPGPGGSGLIATRSLVANATSGVIPLIGNTFDASQLVASLVAGTFDANLTVLGTPFVGTDGVGGFFNNELTGGTLTSAGGVETLTIPVLVVEPFVINGVTVLIAFSGQIVANAAVPEPSALILATLGGLALLAISRRARTAPISG
jgi:hypothetical protein